MGQLTNDMDSTERLNNAEWFGRTRGASICGHRRTSPRPESKS